jgi:2-haloacid dehalogenase/putative hydrolase of the HAD superfamily
MIEGRPEAVLFDIGPQGSSKAVLFDIGNVLVRWDPRTLYAKIFPDPTERDRFLAEVCTMAWHVQHDAGVSWDDTVPALTAQHPHYAQAIAAWRDRWDEMFSGVIPETEAAIEALHARGVPVYGLTNMSVETFPSTMAMSPATQRFADVIVSGHEKVIKPDRRIFEIVCERSGLQPQDFFFIDDSLPNIEAARAIGFHTHHFTDPAALRPDLERHGLL